MDDAGSVTDSPEAANLNGAQDCPIPSLAGARKTKAYNGAPVMYGVLPSILIAEWVTEEVQVRFTAKRPGY